MSLVTNRDERARSGTELFLDDLALTIESSRPHGDRFLVRFEGYTHRTQVEALRGVVCASPLDDEDEIWVHELIGARVIDESGTDRGVVETVQDNPASDLLVLVSGALVPARFIDRVDDGIVHIVAPPGLFELT